MSFANTCGILLLDKPQGLSSSGAVQRVRHAFGRIKAGHTGSLDPLATGVLPLCLGEATKVAGYLLDGDKEYEFTARFGARTATGDLEGDVVETAPVPDELAERLRELLPRFTGELQQVPPMYSALKRDGQPLYRLARQGIEVDREPRRIRILDLQMRDCGNGQATFVVRCSKGTYVRTLAEDLARALGTCAHLAHLRRTAVAPFRGACHAQPGGRVGGSGCDPAAGAGCGAAAPGRPDAGCRVRGPPEAGSERGPSTPGTRTGAARACPCLWTRGNLPGNRRKSCPGLS